MSASQKKYEYHHPARVSCMSLHCILDIRLRHQPKLLGAVDVFDCFACAHVAAENLTNPDLYSSTVLGTVPGTWYHVLRVKAVGLINPAGIAARATQNEYEYYIPIPSPLRACRIIRHPTLHF